MGSKKKADPIKKKVKSFKAKDKKPRESSSLEKQVEAHNPDFVKWLLNKKRNK